MRVFESSKTDNLKLDLGSEKRPPILFLVLLAALGFSAYFTGVTLVPSIGNNIGPFEATALITSVFTFIYFLRNRLLVRIHFAVKILFLIAVIAIISLPNLIDRLNLGLVQLALLIYTAFLVFVLTNLLIQIPSLFQYLLRFILLGALVAGIWVIYEGIKYNAPIGTGGPFRNRSHVGIYMLTSFWLILLFIFWPNVTKVERMAAVFVIFVVLYGIAVSGRRSVYLSLFIGLAMLGMSFMIVRGVSRFKLLVAVVLAGGILFILAQVGPQYVPQLGFFNERIGLIDDRLELVAGTAEDVENSENFAVLQREGMLNAVADHPLLGIGWGGFFESEYSPTGHEMHSTPQRFLTELGIIGFSLYLIYNAYLWFGSARLFFRVRNTDYQLPALIFMVAIWSLTVSWAYNRSVTERTYWLLIILFISFETIVNVELAKRRRSEVNNKPRRPGYYRQPGQQTTPPVMPISRK